MFSPRAHKPPTSNDVARLAGVSRATVSFVLNDKPDARIPDDTRQRVLDAAARLGYTPDNRAQRLRLGGVEGLLVPAPVIGFGGAMDAAFALLAQNSPRSQLPTIVHADHEISGVEGARVWARYRPEAVLVEADRCDEGATEILRLAGVRALLLFGPVSMPHAPSLVVEQGAYGRLAVEHMVARGHRQLVWLHPTERLVAGLAAGRFAGAVDAARSAGVPLDVVTMDTDPRSLSEWTRGWRSADDRPTGIIAYDDRFAYVAIRAMADAGLRVPEDVSIVGADDYATSAVFLPSVTSITFKSDSMASLILDTIIRLRSGENVRVVHGPPLAVIERESG